MIKAELYDKDRAVLVTFNYNPEAVERIKRLPRDSRKFVPANKPGGPGWRVRKDLVIMRRLREQFGDSLELGPKLKQWGHQEVSKERNLKDLSMADDADLDNIPTKLWKGPGGKKYKGVPMPGRMIDGKQLYFKLRPYQKADIKFMSEGASINANQPGTGKTAEWILSIIEAELEWGQHLVCAPLSALEDPWEDEIQMMYRICGLDEPTVFSGDTVASRKRAVLEAKEAYDEGLAFWLVLNPYMMRGKEQLSKEGKDRLKENMDIDSGDFHFEFHHQELAEIEWDTTNVDEFHLCGLTGDGTKSKQTGRKAQFTQFAEGFNRIVERAQPTLRCCMSGTPMGGKPIKLWYALHHLDPEKFPSKWAWARQWLVIEEGEYGSSIEGIQPGREQEFYEHLKPWLIRRTTPEALKGLPPKVPIDVWCSMSAKQQEQYETFERDAEWRMGEAEDAGRLSATNVLSEYTRLKQFASAFCEVEKTGKLDKFDMPVIKVRQTLDSGKFDQLMEKLGEENVLSDDEPKYAIVASQFVGVVDAVVAKLEKEKVPVAKIDGSVKTAKRTAIKKAFQEQREVEYRVGRTTAVQPPIRVVVLQTIAGGTALTLTRANSVHILDETWNPDDTEQVEYRGHDRADAMTMEKTHFNVYRYRTRKTIEEHIEKLNLDKDDNNKKVLELRRYMKQSHDEDLVAA